MDAAWSGDERSVVGIVDGETDSDREPLESISAPDGATTVRGDLETVLTEEPSVLVAAGERTLSAIVRAGVAVPVLPVGDVTGIESVDPDRLSAALEAVLEGEATVTQRRVLGVAVERGTDSGRADDSGDDGETHRALFDVTLVTDEPARISEYSVSSRGETVASFRADGVVVATPAGSHGYASAVEAPHLSAAVDAVAVAPIAPFVTQTRRWVLPDDAITVTVERNETDVTLVVDDRSLEMFGVGTQVAIGVDGTLPILSVSAQSLGT